MISFTVVKLSLLILSNVGWDHSRMKLLEDGIKQKERIQPQLNNIMTLKRLARLIK